MGRIVYQELKGISVPADATCDVWSLIASATHPIVLHGFEMTSNATAAAIIDVNLHRVTAAGTGGTASTTEELADEELSAVTAGVRTLDTTPGADGGGLLGWQWEQLGPIGIVFTPEMRPKAKVSEGFALTWNTATAATCSGWICWEEL